MTKVNLFADFFSKSPIDSSIEEVYQQVRSDAKLMALTTSTAFIDLGFKQVRHHAARGYLVIVRTAEEIRQYQQRLAVSSQTEDYD